MPYNTISATDWSCYMLRMIKSEFSKINLVRQLLSSLDWSVLQRRGSIVRYRGQWMAAYRAAVPLAHADQLPLPGLWSAAVYESSHVSSGISSISKTLRADPSFLRAVRSSGPKWLSQFGPQSLRSLLVSVFFSSSECWWHENLR